MGAHQSRSGTLETQMTHDSDTDPELQVPFGHDPKVCGPVMDEDDANNAELREFASKAVRHWKGVFRALLIFKGNPAFALRCAIAAHGFWDLLSERDQNQIARKFHCSRAHSNQLTNLIQRRLGLPQTLGQRDTAERQSMYETRKSQLRKPN